MNYPDLVKFHGAVAHWRLDEVSGTVVKSQVGSFDGTISGGVALNQSGALSDGSKAMSVIDTTGRITIPNGSYAAVGTGPVTVELWWRSSVFPANSYLCDTSYNGDSGHPGFSFVVNPPSTLTWNLHSSGPLGAVTIADYPLDSAWHQIVGIVNRGSPDRLSLYLDGIFKGQSNLASNGMTLTSTRGLIIGASHYLPIESTAGLYDEVAIYHTALTPQQIADHYNTAKTGSYTLASVALTTGQTINIQAGVVYAIPSYPVTLTAGAQVQTSILEGGPYTNVSNGLITGRFLKSATNTTVKLTKYILAA